MLTLVKDPCIDFVNTLLESVEYEGSCQSPTVQRVKVRLSSSGVIFCTPDDSKKIIVYVVNSTIVDYTFKQADGIQGPRQTTTTSNPVELAKEIVNYFTDAGNHNHA